MNRKPQITNVKAVILIKVVSAFALFFFVMMFVSSLFREDRTLNLESEIDLEVFNVKNDRGFLILQDSVVVSGNCKLITEISKMKILESYKLYDTIAYKKFSLTIGDVTKPYRILKKSFSDTLIVYHYQDTLFFKVHGLRDESFIEKWW